MTKVAVVRTSPKTVLDDVARVMDLAEYRRHVSKDLVTTVKLNLSWSKFYPACSTNPYILDGVLTKLITDGYEARKIQAVENPMLTGIARLPRICRYRTPRSHHAARQTITARKRYRGTRCSRAARRSSQTRYSI